MELSMELIPKTCWHKNLREMLKKSDWDKIRKEAYAKANGKCEICYQETTAFEAHEIWEFDEEKHVQKLIGIIAVCKACHSAIHYGRAQQLGFGEQAIEQFLKVNDWDMLDFRNHEMESMAQYNRRSKINDWKLDISFITNQGYEPIQKLQSI